MSLEETLRDLRTVLNADIFTSEGGMLGVRGFFPGKEKVEQMQKLLLRDEEEIRHAHDAMEIKYGVECRDWLTQAGNYLNLRPMEVERFNNSYENMLAYYAGRIVDQFGIVPPEVLIAQNRFDKYKSRREKEIAL